MATVIEVINDLDLDDHRYVEVTKAAKGSPAYMVREVYQSTDSPTGWYAAGEWMIVAGATSTENAVELALAKTSYHPC